MSVRASNEAAPGDRQVIDHRVFPDDADSRAVAGVGGGAAKPTAEWVTGDVAAILGRPARSFEQFAADHAAAFS
jgi:hypothetical protein